MVCEAVGHYALKWLLLADLAARLRLLTHETTTGQGKGSATSPVSASLALPYSDNFDSYTSPQEAKYFSDMEGSFEAASCTGGRSGGCLEQEVDQQPIEWPSATGHTPLTYMGDSSWSNYTVSTDALLAEAGHVRLAGRIFYQPQNSEPDAYILDVQDTGAWQLQVFSAGSEAMLASGTVSFSINTWHTLSLTFNGSNIMASIDGGQVASVNDTTYASGLAGLGTLWNKAQFDNFSMQPVSGSTTVDDSVQGPGQNQFNYVGSAWGHCANCNAPGLNVYNNSDSWDNVANDYVTVSFTGTSIQFYGVVDTNLGMGAVSVDGGAETPIDFYAPTRQGSVLLWTSPVLAPGTHTFKLRVTNTKDASNSATYAAPDYVAIFP